MPRGDKSKYTDKQERKADHIAEGYEKRGVSEKEAERRAWATVNTAARRSYLSFQWLFSNSGPPPSPSVTTF